MSEGLQRRDFLKVVGASGAGAGLVGCSTQGAEKLLPYVVPPEEITPGVATWYATTCHECNAGCGVWARTREGRVIKLEGNPNHPVSQGAMCSIGHSALQGLYNPDRLAGPMRKNGDSFEPITWDEAEQLVADQVRAAGGRLAFLCGTMGPSLHALVEEFIAAAGGRVVHYDGLIDRNLEEAARIAFGNPANVRYELDQANLVFSFGADFLGGGASQVEYTRKYAAMSHTNESLSKGKMVFFSPRLSLTGQNADEWVPIQPGSEAGVALAMASRIAGRNGAAGPYAAQLRGFDIAGAARDAGITTEDIERLADEFASSTSVAVGPGLQSQHGSATAANLAVLILNDVVGNIGRTVQVQPQNAMGTPADVMAATTAAAGGVVMVHGPNPVYSMPGGVGFNDAFAAAAFRVSFAQTMDETAAQCDLVLPDRNALESWGDHASASALSIRQPVMQPLPMFDSKQTGDVLLSVAGRLSSGIGATTFYEYLQNRWRGVHQTMDTSGGSFDDWWRASVRDGFVRVAGAGTTAAFQAPSTPVTFETPSFEGNGDFFLTVYPSGRLGDGRYANRPWLQELPDPVSKVMWQSFLEIHPDAAAEMDLRDGDHVVVASPTGEVEVPVWIYPGIRPDTVALAMGSGHTDFGQFATGQGVNAMNLLSGSTDPLSGSLVLSGTRVSVTPTGQWTRPANIAGSTDDHDRPIVPAIALADLGHAEEDHGDEGGHGQLKELQLLGGFKPVETDGSPQDYPLPGISEYAPYNDPNTPRWAMAIDLDKCTGCSACVTACQAENNIPFVGEQQVVMGREMHWMRIERYYETVDATHAGPVDVRFLPMLCQQCGNAPCEPVCPVFATYHTPDGINAQIYNRCVGTRYCANNCPYKLRVYNWYRYATQLPSPLEWQFNPEVTVRDNGVMEKCSFCMHRVREAGHAATLADRDIHEGEVITACQQSCPADAIVFGNIRDEDSAVAHAVANERTYRVLDALINTQPAVNYQKKVTHHEVAAPEH